LTIEEGKYLSLKEFLGLDTYLQLIANRTLPGMDNEGYEILKERIYNLWSTADSSDLNEHILRRIRNILIELSSGNKTPQEKLTLGKNNMKAIFIHHFMDIHNFDFSRAMKCCNPYAQHERKLVPLCVQNVCF
jgi:uncharacterized radical SAM superfamily Fe-S cluster-containing enzyme